MVVTGTCKLCLTPHAALQDSHLAPRAAYGILRRLGGCISIDERTAVLKDNQLKAHLLCVDCEQRFSRYGEDWVMAHCYRGDTFHLRAMLECAFPIQTLENLNWYSIANIPGIRIDDLTYFAASILWRSACTIGICRNQ